MKTILLAGLLLGAVPAFAQKAAPAPALGQEAAEPFKGANVILVSTGDSVAVAYKKIGAAILGAGYTIDQADRELGFINTKPHATPSGSPLHTVRVVITPAQTGAVIELRGALSLARAMVASPMFAGESQTAFRGMKGSAFMVCWQELQAMARAYPSGKLSYLKKP